MKVDVATKERNFHSVLKQRFGFRHFRPGQAKSVQAAIDRKDAIVIMSTGSGKSLCFQFPALELPGMTVVVSPLIALMKDQVDQLRAQGIISAVAVNSALSAQDRDAAQVAIADEGGVRLVSN